MNVTLPDSKYDRPTLARILGVHVGTLGQWAHYDRGPAYLLDFDGKAQYRRSAVTKWAHDDPHGVRWSIVWRQHLEAVKQQEAAL